MLGSIFRRCSRPCIDSSAWRQFSTTPAVQLRRDPKSAIRVPSKKAMAAKAKRREAIAAKLDAKAEKLPLLDAIQVLRAVEVASPNAIYELSIKTLVGNGIAVPKGRVSLPREAKSSPDEKILKAGADFVGGLEMCEAILNNRLRPTTVLCTPDLIRAITPRLGRFLGPSRGTVVDDVAGYLQRLRGTIRAPIAVMNFPVEDVVKNIRHFLTSVKKATGNMRDESDRNRAKGSAPKPVTPIKKVILSSRQGPGIRIADI
ncbi:50S ribosomal protein L1 [Ephemerocybe angulata]|uniref:50S ribosomal protein L1 n=1 Tax=Ephemerocybe angulata TaxID=980116 RepID=A0A8H6M6U3_9AGAR|nr:50S ribosomal protein L1 [Tulosesus angulatus]